MSNHPCRVFCLPSDKTHCKGAVDAKLPQVIRMVGPPFIELLICTNWMKPMQDPKESFRLASHLSLLDWGILAFFLAGILVWSAWLGRGQRSSRDYYLAGNTPPWWAVGLSTLATQCSTNSLLGGPAFVAFAAGGGLVFLQWELAVPMAMILLMVFVFPVLRASRVVSIYEFLEQRLGLTTRTTVSVLFQFFRAFATGVTIYGVSLLLSHMLQIPFAAAVLLFAATTILYDFLGGMRAVIWTDVIQFLFLFGGIGLALMEIVQSIGGWGNLCNLTAPERLNAFRWKGHGMGDGETYSLLPMFIGGLFLYASYYGFDQTQAQRILSCRNDGDSMRALCLNGLVRLPLALVYALVGVALAAYASIHSSFLWELPLKPDLTGVDYNMALPIFVIKHLPQGIVGLIVVGLFAAAMSSLDSTLNSLSAATAEDVIGRFGWFGVRRGEPVSAWMGRFTTLFWGAICTFFAFFAGNISDSIIITINKIGSVSYGPVLGIFALALFRPQVGEKPALLGLAAGYAVNILLWIKFDPAISWLWWNVAGTAACLATALAAAPFNRQTMPHIPWKAELPKNLKWNVLIMLAWSLVILSSILIIGKVFKTDFCS
ncbi:MAG: sodium:proline symporter [Verrucomicrobiae bacterium]|nr:sodium:proline symporter [Verrucomicrobiae bacterium]